MTNEVLLREAITESGYKMLFIAKKIGLSYQGFLNKLTNRSEFTAPEILALCKLLNINGEERDKIFFAEKVDKTSS